MRLVGIAILISFYAIYFGKMVAQRRQGIRTDQLAWGGKPRKVIAVEFVMKLATFAVVAAEVASIFLYGKGTPSWLFPAACLPLRIAGAVIGIGGVVVFGLAVHEMRDSWRAGIPAEDRTELVTSGIFRFGRNPAFLGFDLLYAGLCAMFFNWVLLAFTLCAIVMLHLQTLQEERFMAKTFGPAYQNYKSRTRRYYGRKTTEKLR